VHLITGVAFLAGAYVRAPATTIRVIAVLYAIVAIIGFVTKSDMLFGLIQMNMADNWLHLAIAAVLLLIGFLTPAEERVSRVGV
jgi:hypothetical protein